MRQLALLLALLLLLHPCSSGAVTTSIKSNRNVTAFKEKKRRTNAVQNEEGFFLQQKTTTTSGSSTGSTGQRQAQQTDHLAEEGEVVVNFVFTATSLLSADDLKACHNDTDPGCHTGVAAVGAFVRHYNNNNNYPTLVVPVFEKASQFVMVHPMGWNMNRVVLQGVMGWDLFLATPSILLQDQRDHPGTSAASSSSSSSSTNHRDLSFLQSDSFPLVLSNVLIPPSNTWASSGYHEFIHYDETTRLALITIADDGQAFNFPQDASAVGLLDAIQEKNAKIGSHCIIAASSSHSTSHNNNNSTPSDGDLVEETLRAERFAYYETMIQDSRRESVVEANGVVEEELNSSSSRPTNNQTNCWIPIIVNYHTNPAAFAILLDALKQAPNPPALVLDSGENTDMHVPTIVTTTNNNNKMWVHSYWLDSHSYVQHQIVVDTNSVPPTVKNVTVVTDHLENLSDDRKDETYGFHIRTLRDFADEAIENDPLVVANSTIMPPQLDCQDGECESGNLFATAIQWATKADVAFLASGAFRGNGWPEGAYIL